MKPYKCIKCGSEEFYLKPKSGKKVCSLCMKKTSAEWRKNNKKRVVELNRAWRKNSPEKYSLNCQRTIEKHREKRTGWTKKLFESAWSDQEGCCAICKVEMLPKGQKNNSVAADHCHATAKTRALLCMKCNKMLGLLEKNRTFFTVDALAYLEKHGEPASLFQKLRRSG